MNQRVISNLLSLLVCLLLGIGIAVVLLRDTETTESPVTFEGEVRTLKVNVLTLNPEESFLINREYHGQTRAKRAVDLAFSKPGRIKKILVREGDTVSEDDVLAELESKTDLEAPFDGVIASKHMSVGSFANPGVPVFRIIQGNDLEASFRLPLGFAKDLREGDGYRIRVSEEEYLIEVDAILPEIDPIGKTRTVIFSLPKVVSERHLPGETAKLLIPSMKEEPGFWVPVSALTRETRGLWSLFALDQDSEDQPIVKRHFVEVIHVENDRAWASGTIDGETKVIADGTHRIVPGQRVEPVELAE